MAKHAIGRLRMRRRVINTLTTRLVGLGGAAVIAAIALIFFYLLWVVAPLFQSATVDAAAQIAGPSEPPLLLDVDDNSEIGLEIGANGVARFFSLTDGLDIDTFTLTEEPVTQVVRAHGGNNRYVLRTQSGLLFIDTRYAVSFDGNQRRVSPQVDYPFGHTPLAVGDLGSFEVYRTDETVTIAGLRANNQLVLIQFDDAPAGLPLEFGTTNEVSLENAFSRVVFGPRGDWLYLIDRTGTIEVFDIGVQQAPRPVFRGQLVPERAKLLAVEPLIGRYSLLVADDRNRVTQWFLVRDEFGYRMAPARFFEFDAMPRLLIAEPRRKGFAVIDDQNRVHLAYTTSDRVTATVSLEAVITENAVLSPRADRLLVSGGGRLAVFDIHNEHPDVSATALWSKVWYEGYPEPVWSWQSSASDNAFEPKFSLTPLAFGTLKAAFYAMLVAMPLAIMGAIYTAYFMAPTMRRWVKPGIEIMAALPTVILGFLAGLWLAPLLEANLVGILFAVLILPPSILLFARLWQLLPARIVKACNGWYGAIIVPVMIAVLVFGLEVGPSIEIALFAGNAKAWLLSEFGLEYDQRNALVVGIAMGLAVIPTIFSIAEDAIYGVPRHLINGSLALGATWWQTLVRVVLLTASPGIFSAVMIGMGRAVGETMIVLMATGNTAVMDMNIFQGMRTFSANLAVELPESEVGGTHYRVLFLAALVLFLITFAFNTVAELVRQRLRARYGSL